MANAHKGELAFKAAEQSYTLRFSANAICELEAQLDCTCSDVVDQLNEAISKKKSPRYSLLRALLWAGLTDRHPTITLKQAGDLIDAIGGVSETMAVVVLALKLAFPDATSDATSDGTETKGEDPPNGAGSGPVSTPAG